MNLPVVQLSLAMGDNLDCILLPHNNTIFTDTLLPKNLEMRMLNLIFILKC